MKRLTLIAVATVVLLLSLYPSPALPRYFSYNLFALVVVLILLGGATRTAYGTALGGAWLIDLLSALPFGTALIAYPFGLALTSWLFRTRFTNRSLLAYLALVMSGTLLIEVLLLTTSLVGQLLDPQGLAILLNDQWITTVAVTLIRNLILSAVIYAALRLSGQSYAALSQREF